MCGRYHFTAEDSSEIMEIIQRIQDVRDGASIKTGEICPTDLVPVLIPGRDRPEPVAMIWGFPHFKGSGVIINARSETVMEKAMFRNSVLSRRCVVPSTGFFEWSRQGKEKTKYLFHRPGQSTLYMAGCWNTFREKDGSETQRFVILTTKANDSLKEDTGILSLFRDASDGQRWIHDRMPVILDEEETKSWLFGGVDFDKLFAREHVVLTKEMI